MSEVPPGTDLKRQPIFNIPAVILVLAAALAAVHAWRDYRLSALADAEVLRTFAFVPGRLTAAFDMNAIAAALNAVARDPVQLDTARYFLADASPQYWTPLTYAALHGDWMHLGINCLWLAAFGGPVAMRFGWVRFLALFAVTAIGGAMMHYALHRLEFLPVVGASASVSGIMAAAVRFVFQPGAPLGPPLPGWPLPPDLAARLPAVSLSAALSDRRVLQFTLIWFAINFVFGVAAGPLGIAAGGVAWEAHAGGFLTGFLLFRFFDPPQPPQSEFDQWRNPPSWAAGGGAAPH